MTRETALRRAKEYEAREREMAKLGRTRAADNARRNAAMSYAIAERARTGVA